MNSLRLDKVLPFALSLLVSIIAMTCYCVLDECVMINLSPALEEECPDGQFAHQQQCYHHLGQKWRNFQINLEIQLENCFRGKQLKILSLGGIHELRR